MNVWRDRLSRWFTPLALRCPVSPNTISILALLLNAAGAACLYTGARQPVFFLIAIGLTTVGGLADAFDGIVARAQHKESRYGDFLDHVADRISDVLLAAGWLLASGVRQELTLAAIALTMLNGYVGTQIEATYGERNYDSVGRGEFVLALIVYPVVSYILATNGWTLLRGYTLTIAEWMTVLMIAFAVLGIVQRFVLARRLEKP
jgi:phosphatidylglycerophosphate synthase